MRWGVYIEGQGYLCSAGKYEKDGDNNKFDNIDKARLSYSRLAAQKVTDKLNNKGQKAEVVQLMIIQEWLFESCAMLLDSYLQTIRDKSDKEAVKNIINEMESLREKHAECNESFMCSVCGVSYAKSQDMYSSSGSKKQICRTCISKLLDVDTGSKKANAVPTEERLNRVRNMFPKREEAAPVKKTKSNSGCWVCKTEFAALAPGETGLLVTRGVTGALPEYMCSVCYRKKCLDEEVGLSKTRPYTDAEITGL